MTSIREYLKTHGLHDNKQGNKDKKTTIHKEKISRGVKCNWEKRRTIYKNQDRFVDVIAKKMLQDIKNVKENFSDIGNRQIFYDQFKENINNMWDCVSDDDFSKELVMVLTDSINNIKAENLNLGQLEAIRGIIEMFPKGKITEEELDSYMELLLENDIPLVLLPTNISDSYD